MTNSVSKVQVLVWGGLALIVASIVVAFGVSRFKEQPLSTLPESHDPNLPVYGQLPDFQLTDQNGQPVSLSSLLGQVWVADIVFTRCPGQCLQMSSDMKDLQANLPPDNSIRLISL